MFITWTTHVQKIENWDRNAMLRCMYLLNILTLWLMSRGFRSDHIAQLHERISNEWILWIHKSVLENNSYFLSATPNFSPTDKNYVYSIIYRSKYSRQCVLSVSAYLYGICLSKPLQLTYAAEYACSKLGVKCHANILRRTKDSGHASIPTKQHKTLKIFEHVHCINYNLSMT